MKRILAKCDAFNILPSTTSEIGYESVRYYRTNDYVRRVAAFLDAGNAAEFPAHDIKLVLSAVVDECRGSLDSSPSGIGNNASPLRKQTSMAPTNDDLSTLLFVEKIIRERYKQIPSIDTDADFLECEMNRYFGTNDDAFKAEEELLCLAFNIALHMARQSDNRVLTSPSHDGVIKAALRVVDEITSIDKRERRLRDTRQTNASVDPRGVEKRKRYEHLLQPVRKHAKTGTASETKSIMEVKYEKEWEWLCEFRKMYESEMYCSGRRTLQESSQYESAPMKSIEDEDPSTTTLTRAVESNFVVMHRNVASLDDISSDDESDHEMKGNTPDASPSVNAPETPAGPQSPYDKLDKETHELRMSLLDMPENESSSAEVITHTVEEICSLLSRYGEVDGANGVSRCGSILCGHAKLRNTSIPEPSTNQPRFLLNDAMVSSLASAYLTDATGSLRARAFLQSFVLPLVVGMNPVAKAAVYEGSVDEQSKANDQSKPASRSVTSLLTSLSRDRPIECVVSVVVPSLVLKKCIPSVAPEAETSFEPTRFQSELILRILRGKDALTTLATSQLVEQVLPIGGGALTSHCGMKWTENTMPLLTACMNRQPTLSNDAVSKMADEVSRHLLPTSPSSMLKSMKLSSLFHALVTKYGSQVKAVGKVDSLKDSASRLKTFMSKTISLALKKLS